MKILFAAPEDAWGGFLGLIRAELPEHHFEATGRFAVDTLKGFDVLIPTMCSVSQELLETGDQLRLIQQCGSGLEMIDLDATQRFNIQVANVPTDISGNADSVAELCIYMIIGLSRDVRGMSKSLAQQSMGQPQGRALNGRTIGLIGLGGIGRALVKRLKAFGVYLIGIKRYNPKNAREKLGMDWVGRTEDLKELLSRSDFVILCLPLTPESEDLIDRDAFSSMKNEAYLNEGSGSF
jgi:phosphoglycerate dehydrogenase-like enzyme